MDVRLEHIDPEANMFRFYEVGVEPNLFGDHSVIIRWGRIGRRGRMRIHASGQKRLASVIAEKIIIKKLKKGYAPVTA